jgi:thiol peroxidase
LLGPELIAGRKAPDFRVVRNDMSPATLADFKGKTKVILSVPSVDTPVCDVEVRRFNKEAAALDNVVVLCVSVDLPFAQKRWCGAAGIDKVTTLSDYKELSFAKAYGVFIKETHLLARAVFVIDAEDEMTYVEYVPEITSEPSYEGVLEHLKHHQATKA